MFILYEKAIFILHTTIMTFSFFVLIIFKYLVLTESADESIKFNISGICGFPGEPISARHNIGSRTIFTEGDIVEYECSDFLSYKQQRRCHKGKWIGPQVRCGHGINNNINRVVIKDCITNQVLFDYNYIKLENNNERFVNSFSTDRYNEKPIRVPNSTCSQWHLHVNEKSHFSFVRIDFAIVFGNATNSNEEIPDVDTTFDEYSGKELCQVEARKKYRHNWTNKWINFSHKYHYYLNCHTNSHNGEARFSNVFTVKTKSRIPLTIDLIRFAIANVYRSDDGPKCGVPEIPFGVSTKLIKEHQIYELHCNEQSFTSTTEISSTQINCSPDTLWVGTYPECKPKKSCDNSLTIKNMGHTLIDRIENVYYFNESIWFAIEGSIINYNCNQHSFNSFGSKTRECLSTGLWNTKEPLICRTNQTVVASSSPGMKSSSEKGYSSGKESSPISESSSGNKYSTRNESSSGSKSSSVKGYSFGKEYAPRNESSSISESSSGKKYPARNESPSGSKSLSGKEYSSRNESSSGSKSLFGKEYSSRNESSSGSKSLSGKEYSSRNESSSGSESSPVKEYSSGKEHFLKNESLSAKEHSSRNESSFGEESSMKFVYFLPFYIMAGITSLVLIVTAISALISMKRYKVHDNANSCECPSLGPASFMTDDSYLDDSPSMFQFEYQYQNEPIYDVPSNRLKSFRYAHNQRTYDDRVYNNLPSEPVYDHPKTRPFNPNN